MTLSILPREKSIRLVNDNITEFGNGLEARLTVNRVGGGGREFDKFKLFLGVNAEDERHVFFFVVLGMTGDADLATLELPERLEMLLAVVAGGKRKVGSTTRVVVTGDIPEKGFLVHYVLAGS